MEVEVEEGRGEREWKRRRKWEMKMGDGVEGEKEMGEVEGREERVSKLFVYDVWWIGCHVKPNILILHITFLFTVEAE
ncbi:MAG: hypothetical protein ACREBR_01975 [bacterium]